MPSSVSKRTWKEDCGHNFRVDAIQKLRSSQQGPSAVLAEIKAALTAFLVSI